MKVLSVTGKQKQMGMVSNLITDMNIMGATEAELPVPSGIRWWLLTRLNPPPWIMVSFSSRRNINLRVAFLPLYLGPHPRWIFRKRKAPLHGKGWTHRSYHRRKVRGSRIIFPATKESKTKALSSYSPHFSATRMELVDDARKLSSGTQWKSHARYAII